MSKSKDKTNAKASATKIIVVLGIDEDGKPHAGKFSLEQSDLVTRAAELLQLSAYEVDPASLGELGTKIPAGRLYSNGRGFVPHIRRDRFSKLIAALGLFESSFVKPATEGVPVAQGLPSNWDSISVGHMVLAREDGDQDGWWEAIVVAIEADMLTLRYRDYPKQPKVKRHRNAVALVNPGLQ